MIDLDAGVPLGENKGRVLSHNISSPLGRLGMLRRYLVPEETPTRPTYEGWMTSRIRHRGANRSQKGHDTLGLVSREP